MSSTIQLRKDFGNITPKNKITFNSKPQKYIPLEPHSSENRAVASSSNGKRNYSSSESENPYKKSKTPQKNTFGHFKANANIRDDKYEGSFNNKSFQSRETMETAVEVPPEIPELRRVLSGSVQKLLKWHKLLNSPLIIYKVVGCLVQIRSGIVQDQRVMLLRSCDEKGPVLQVIYYTNDRIKICDFHIGQFLRCVGGMSGTNMLRANNIRDASEREVRGLARLEAICDRSVSKLIQ